MDVKDLLKDLNPRQREAATSRGSHLLIVAGPGTGKTRVLTSRIIYLVEQGTAPEEILAVTFTNKAAKEIRQRLRSAAGGRLPQVATFHSWAYHLISETLGAGPYVLGEADQLEIVREARANADIKKRPKELYERLVLLKQEPEPYISLEDEEFRPFWDEYHRLLGEYGVWDYDDLLIKALAILKKGRRLSLRHVLVDEFQDVNRLQYAILEILGGFCHLTAIGDQNQSIYGFRGADPALIKRFKREFSPVKTVELLDAYRCPQGILDAAAALLGEKRPLVSKSSKRAEIVFGVFENEEKEASWIAHQIDRISGGMSFESFNVSGHDSSEQRSLSDVCILYRTRSMSRKIEAALTRCGIPFHTPLRTNRKTEEVLTAFHHLLEFSRGRARRFHLSRLKVAEEEAKNLSGLLEALIRGRGEGQEFFKGLEKALGMELTEEDKSLILQHLGFFDRKEPASLVFKEEQDELDFSVEAVTLMTLHASKGLEFPVVFLAGIDREIVPWKESDKEEERRLLYVGITRSFESLFITSSRRRRLYGRMITTGPSPFLQGLEGFFTPVQRPLKRPRKRSMKKKQKSLF